MGYILKTWPTGFSNRLHERCVEGKREGGREKDRERQREGGEHVHSCARMHVCIHGCREPVFTLCRYVIPGKCYDVNHRSILKYCSC